MKLIFRHFLLFFIPSIFLISCDDDITDDGPKSKLTGKVIIIGAGAAGLQAAYTLHDLGADYTVLEAQDHYGGRMGENLTFADFPIDLGAQWLHGNHSMAANHAAAGNISYSQDNSEAKYWFQNKLVSKLPEDLDIFEGNFKPDKSYAQYAKDKGYGDEYKYIVEGIAGDQGAAATRLSVKWNNEEEEGWRSGDEDYKFSKTYFEVIKTQLAEKVKDHILFNQAVKSIDYSGTEVKITTNSDSVYYCQKVLITVPITVLKDGDIEFIPALPKEKTDAFQKIGMDQGMKVFLKFSSKFYDGNIIGGKICGAYADESEGKSGSDHVLLAFVMGTQAEYLNTLGSEQAIINALLQELDEMYTGAATASYLDALVVNWAKNPYIKGAYSYSTVGMGEDARALASKSVNDKLYFAGEAMNTSGHHQTVHGALESGFSKAVLLMGH